MSDFATLRPGRGGRGGETILGLRLAGIRSLDERQGFPLQIERGDDLTAQMAFLAGFGHIRPRASLELRLIRDAAEPHRVELVILARVGAGEAESTGRFLLESLDAYCPYLRFVPVTDREDLKRLVSPFEIDGVVELTRRDAVISLDSPRPKAVADRGLGVPLDYGSRGRKPVEDTGGGNPAKRIPASEEEATVYAALPFLLTDDSRETLFRALLGATGSICISIVMRPHILSPGDRSFLENRLARTEKYHQLHIEDEREQPYLRLQSQLLFDLCVRELRQFDDAAYLIRARVACDGAVPESVIAVLGSSFSPHSGAPLGEYARGESPIFSGGYRVRFPRDEEEAQAMRADFRSAAAEPHAPSLAPPGHSALLHLFDITEASTVFRLPLPLVTRFPGLDFAFVSDTVVPARLPDEGLLLGVHRGTGGPREIRMPLSDRFRHIYVVGQTGTGKSTLLSNLIRQDAVEGRGFGLIDPHGELIDEVLEHIPKARIDDVILVDPTETERPIPMNILRASNSLERDFIVNYLIETFYSIYTMQLIGGPTFEMYLRNILMLLLCQPAGKEPSFLDIPDVLQSSRIRNKYLGTCTEERVVRFWKEEADKAGGDLTFSNIVPYFTSKFSAFVYNETMRNILGRRESTIDYARVMDEGKILLVDLRKGLLGATNAHFIGLMVIGEILRATLARTARKTRTSPKAASAPRPFFLYVDEFQNVATQSFLGILSEARKYGLGAVLANQYIKQLDPSIQSAVIGNVGTILSFRVGREDATLLSNSLGAGVEAQDLVALPNFKVAARPLLDGYVHPAFPVDTLLPEGKPSPSVAAKIRANSRMVYGRPLEVPEPKGDAKTAGPETEVEEISPEAELARLFGED